MKLTTLIMILAIMQVSAVTHAQKVTLAVHNALLTAVFQQLRDQTGYDFAYTADELKNVKPVTINVKNEELKDVLDQIFDGQALTFTIEERSVVVTQKEPREVDKVKAHVGTIDVSAKIVDEFGAPLVGATISYAQGNSTVQATTDKAGKFLLHQVQADIVITISYIGYESQFIKAVNIVNGSKIILKVASTNLHEVVINKGYYNEKEVLSTGDATVITAKEIDQQPVSDPILALEGRVPGMTITQQSGKPGDSEFIQIRGQNSMTQGSAPLFVVDGVPFGDQPITTIGAPVGNGYGLNPFNLLNPNDIESITVLKDADATSIYGSRGANGVVLITTKKGKVGDIELTAKVQDGAGHIDGEAHLMNTQQYLDMRRQAFINDGITPTATNAPDLINWSQTSYTDWQKYAIGNTSNYLNADIGISGGSTNTQFLVGGTYHKETTVFPGQYAYETGSMHFSLSSISANNKFKMQLTGSYMAVDNVLPQADYISMITMPPNAPPLYLSNGQLNWNDYLLNPLRGLFESYHGMSKNLITGLSLSYEIIKGLQINVNMSYNLQRQDDISETGYEWYPPRVNVTTGSASFGNNVISTWNIEPQLSYHKSIGKGEFNALVGGTLVDNSNHGYSIAATGYTDDALLGSLAGATSLYNAGVASAYYKTASIYSRLGYVLDDKYVLNLTARRDGSSRFGPGKQYGNFGSAGAAWIFSRESYIKNNLPWLSFGKLRVSYGITGNDQIGNYQYLSLYNITTGQFAYQNGTSLTPTTPLLQDYAWEIDKKLEAGLELGFFDNRVNLTLSAYRNRSGNQLLGYSLPLITGFSGITANLPALVQNSGLEVTFNTINIKKRKFKWETNFNISHNANKLIAFPNLANTTLASNLAVGQPLNSIQVYKYAGINANTGLYQFYSKDGKLTSNPNPITDKTERLNLWPNYFGGLGNTFSYNGIQLDIFLQFVKQRGYNYLYSTRIPGYESIGLYGNLPAEYVGNTWTSQNPTSKFQQLSTNLGSNAAQIAYNAVHQSDFAYTDASFIRAKTIALSYNFDNKWIKHVGLNNLRLFIQGENLFKVTSYKGIDPENQSVVSIPPLRVITGGIEVKL